MIGSDQRVRRCDGYAKNSQVCLMPKAAGSLLLAKRSELALVGVSFPEQALKACEVNLKQTATVYAR